ncbi:MAG: hypothetical protein AAF125_26920, partial [Chloroflexota bacterium]
WLATPSEDDQSTDNWLRLAACMPSAAIGRVCERLLFAKDTAEAMIATSKLMEDMDAILDGKSSEITFQLEQFPLAAVETLHDLITPGQHKRILNQFLTTWRHITTASNGGTLIQMGLRPGPQFKTILGRLRAARIDGEVDESGENGLLRKLIAEVNE